MTFLHPALLLMLPLAAIPIILHLITVRRLKTTELSTFRFLFDSYMRQQTRLTWMAALLTMLRTLFLLLLILMICRPVMKKWGALFGGRSGRETILLVDCSASMNARTEGLSALDRAKLAAVSVMDHLDRHERLTLVRVAAGADEVFGQRAPDAEGLRDQIEELEPTPAAANFFGALKQLYERDAKRAQLATVYIFTDAQSGGWEAARQQGLELVVPDEARVIVVNVGSRATLPNLAVTGDAPEREHAVIGWPVMLRARAANFDRGEIKDVPVKLFVNDEEVARASLTLKPGEQRAAEMSFVPKQSGMQRGRFEIAGDRFPDDDSFLFALRVMPPLPVLLVNGKPNADPYENETLYLRTALTATANDNRMLTDFVKSLELREILENQLNDQTLAGVSVVVLANCGALNADQFTRLRQFVADGGGLVIFPGDAVDPKSYSNHFFSVASPQAEALLPVQLEPATGDPAKAEMFQRLAAIDFRHPVFRVFDDPATQPFSTVRFFRHYPLQLIGDASRTWVLARLSDNTPALVEGRLRRGTVLLAAFPANSKWSNLPLKPEFVPLVLQMVNHAQRRPVIEAPAIAMTEGLTEISVAADFGAAEGTLTDPAGHPSPLPFARAGGRLVGTIDPPRLKGFHEIAVRGGRADPTGSVHTVVAANVAATESDFATLRRADWETLLPQARLTVVDASAEAQQATGSFGEQREVWRPLIWFLFILIGIEFTLATMGTTVRWRWPALPWDAGTGRIASPLEGEAGRGAARRVAVTRTGEGYGVIQKERPR